MVSKIIKERIIKEIICCYKKQYPDRMHNFEKLLGLPHKKLSKSKNKNLNKLGEYYQNLLDDMEFLLKLIENESSVSTGEKG